LTEPWGIVTAGMVGGVAAAVTGALAPAGLAVGVPVGLGIAGVVYAVRVGLGALTDRGPRPALTADPEPRLPTPPRGTGAERWLRRAEAAATTLHQQPESPRDPTLRAQIGDVDGQAAGALTDLRRFAGQVTLVEQAIAKIQVERLRHEHGTIQRG